MRGHLCRSLNSVARGEIGSLDHIARESTVMVFSFVQSAPGRVFLPVLDWKLLSRFSGSVGLLRSSACAARVRRGLVSQVQKSVRVPWLSYLNQPMESFFTLARHLELSPDAVCVTGRYRWDESFIGRSNPKQAGESSAPSCRSGWLLSVTGETAASLLHHDGPENDD